MASDIANIIDRIKRDYLEPPGKQAPVFVMNDSGGISASDTSVVTETSNLSAEEEDLLAAGTLIEIGSEIIRVGGVSGTSPDLTLSSLTRGLLGTTAAAHADASDIYLLTEDHVSRLSIFNAVADAIEALYPDLWTVGVEEFGVTEGPIELPAYAGPVMNVEISYGGQWRSVGSWTELYDHPYLSTGRGVQIHGIAQGNDCLVYYKKKPKRPTAETDTWTTLRLEDDWVRVIVISAVAELMASFDLSNFDTEFITQMLRAENRAPGEATDLRNALLQLRNFLITPLMRAQHRNSHDRVIIDQTY